ncbi:hypothetical protein J2Z66_001195 [Paenibacillus eucommiae]|uniref:Uncharacterized protein n=1 Tax=Paenibacillus eucommiae TaxID=1355755 RepID=A0ABS4IPW7_9BACL|nr:hypothetical protein [Paenibacillus eucommiae]
MTIEIREVEELAPTMSKTTDVFEGDGHFV